MKSKSVIIQSDDMPCFKHMIDTISRLRKDYTLLKRIKGAKDKENPESFRSVIGFLEMLIGREKRRLPKEEDVFIDDNSLEILMEVIVDHLQNCEDDLIESTNLGKWARDYATKSSNN